MRRRLIVILMGIVLGACTAGRPQKQSQMRPAWMQQRPTRQAYYIGIGRAFKQQEDYMQRAKRQALADMASEIKVNVQARSMLYQLDKGNQFKEEYISSVRTHTAEELEGFELAGSWENGQEYWLFYRLSKAKWKDLQQQKRQQAIDKASAHFLKARRYERQSDIRQALSAYLKVLETLKDYYAESIEVQLEGESILLLNEAYHAVQRILGNIQLIPAQPSYTYKKVLQAELPIEFTAVYQDPVSDERMPFYRLPVRLNYGSGIYERDHSLSSDQLGKVRFSIHLNDPGSRQFASLRTDHQALAVSESQERFVRKIIETAAPASAQVMLRQLAPLVYLSSEEFNFQQQMEHQPVAAVVRAWLSQKGFQFTDNPAQAELKLCINARSRKGGRSADFQTAYLDVEVELRHQQVVIFSEVLHNIKGVHLSYQQAGQVAYKKSAELLKRQLLPELLRQLD